MVGILLHDAADADDEVVHGAAGGVGILAPHLVQDVRAAHHLARPLHEQLEDHAFLHAQLEGALGPFAAEVVEVHPVASEDLAAADLPALVPGLAAQDGPHAQQQLAHLEGLAQVVVGPGFEAVDAVVVRVLGGEEEDGREVLGLAHLLADGEAVHARQHHIEDHQVEGLGQDLLQGLITPGDPGAGQALQLQVELDALGEAELVFHQQDLGLGHGKLQVRLLE